MPSTKAQQNLVLEPLPSCKLGNRQILSEFQKLKLVKNLDWATRFVPCVSFLQQETTEFWTGQKYLPSFVRRELGEIWHRTIWQCHGLSPYSTKYYRVPNLAKFLPIPLALNSAKSSMSSSKLSKIFAQLCWPWTRRNLAQGNKAVSRVGPLFDQDLQSWKPSKLFANFLFKGTRQTFCTGNNGGHVASFYLSLLCRV